MLTVNDLLNTRGRTQSFGKWSGQTGGRPAHLTGTFGIYPVYDSQATLNARETKGVESRRLCRHLNFEGPSTMTKLLSPLALLAVLFTTAGAFAANHYVRAGASGNGSDWTNACGDFTGSCAISSLVRGDTYYVASGSYGSRTFSTPNSGSLVITVKAATVADHGTSTGWQDSYGVGTKPATFAYPIVINSDYWVFDGQVGSGNTLSSYGFNVAKPTSCNTDPQSYWWIEDKSNITERYIGIDACGNSFNVQQVCFDTGQGSNRTIEHNLGNHCQNTIKLWNASNDTVQYNQLWNQWSTPEHHGESVNNFSTDNITFRYNYLNGCAGTACIACNVGNQVAMNHWKIYGNVFINDSSGNGTIAAVQQVIANTVVYNNTFINITGTGWFLDADPGYGAQAVNNVLKNNLIYNSTAHFGNNGGPIDHDYNSYFNVTNTPTNETHLQKASGNPFVSSGSGDYHLADGTTVDAGLALGSPYNLDPDGNVRGSDGTWDRGAYEFGGDGNGQVDPPSNLEVTVK